MFTHASTSEVPHLQGLACVLSAKAMLNYDRHCVTNLVTAGRLWWLADACTGSGTSGSLGGQAVCATGELQLHHSGL